MKNLCFALDEDQFMKKQFIYIGLKNKVDRYTINLRQMSTFKPLNELFFDFKKKKDLKINFLLF